jgi:hypothetical protein
VRHVQGFVGETRGKENTALERPRGRWEDNIGMDISCNLLRCSPACVNNPKDNMQHLEHDESLKSRIRMDLYKVRWGVWTVLGCFRIETDGEKL